MFFFRNQAENNVQGASSRLFGKALDKIKAGGLELGFAIFR